MSFFSGFEGFGWRCVSKDIQWVGVLNKLYLEEYFSSYCVCMTRNFVSGGSPIKHVCGDGSVCNLTGRDLGSLIYFIGCALE